MILTAIAALAAALSAAPAEWTFRTQTNLLGQPDAVAELTESQAAPGQFLRFSCSVMTGPVFEAGLGARSFESFASFSASEAARDRKIPLTLRPRNGQVLQVLASASAEQVTAHAYAVGGAEAVVAARAISGAESVSISSPDAVAEFSTPGAPEAIAQVLSACPFTG